jgi:UDP-N-acetylglucosamine 2-epimerase
VIVLTVVGARPQFVKAAPVSRLLRERHREVLVHTGQHYDPEMSAVFFRQLGIPEPDQNLGVGPGSHAETTGRMLTGLEAAMLRWGPDLVLVYGDTNSTLAGALAAAKLRLPVAHVEAGMRSGDRAMPEEINRIAADHLSSLLLCSSRTAADNLAAEGITRGVAVTGDVMADALRLAAASPSGPVLERLGLRPGEYLLATVHRAGNVDRPERLASILAALEDLASPGRPVLLPLHPRTRLALERLGLAAPPGVRLVPPQGYLEMVALEREAALILTDSGGVQKEAYWLGVPCVTLREETEWVETVAAGWNVLAGADRGRIVRAVRSLSPPAARPRLYGEGEAAARCVAALEAFWVDRTTPGGTR